MYTVYDKPWRAGGGAAEKIYRPSKNTDKDVYGDDVEKLIKTNKYALISDGTLSIPIYTYIHVHVYIVSVCGFVCVHVYLWLKLHVVCTSVHVYTLYRCNFIFHTSWPICCSQLRELWFIENLTLCMHVHVHVTALGVLCYFALFVCFTLLASFFLPSHLSLKHVHCIYT